MDVEIADGEDAGNHQRVCKGIGKRFAPALGNRRGNNASKRCAKSYERTFEPWITERKQFIANRHSDENHHRRNRYRYDADERSNLTRTFTSDIDGSMRGNESGNHLKNRQMIDELTFLGPAKLRKTAVGNHQDGIAPSDHEERNPEQLEKYLPEVFHFTRTKSAK